MSKQPAPPFSPIPDQETNRAHLLVLVIFSLLSLVIACYVVLHHYFPSIGVVSLTMEQKEEALGKTEQAIYIVTQSKVPTETLDAIAQMNLITLTTALSATLGVQANAMLSQTLAIIRTELDTAETQPLHRQTLQALFMQVRREIKQDNGYFWTDGIWKWTELFFWSLLGTLIYLLTEIYSYYPRDTPNRRFIDMTPWYVINIVRGPFVAMLVLFALTNIQVDIGSFKLGFANASIGFLIFFAGVLGFYSRVANERLTILVEGVLPEAWKRAEETGTDETAFEISPATEMLVYGMTQQFTVVPEQDVTWGLDDQSPGRLTSAGQYTAPTVECAGDTKTVKISTTSTTTKKSAFITFNLSPLQILPTDAQVEFGTTVKFTVTPAIPVTWSIEPEEVGTIDAEGIYTAPNGRTAVVNTVVTATTEDKKITTTTNLTLINDSKMAKDG